MNHNCRIYLENAVRGFLWRTRVGLKLASAHLRGLWHEFQRHAVHATAPASRLRAVIKNMAEMTAATVAGDGGAHHAVGEIF